MSLCIAGCGSTPPAHFYTLLGPESSAPLTAPSSGDLHWVIAVEPVTVPEVVDRPQFVVRTGPEQLDLLESRRWAQPLAREIADAVAADLERALPGAHAYVDQGQAPPLLPGVDVARVTLRVDRFESWPTGDPYVADDVFWAVRCASSEGAPTPGNTLSGVQQIREPASLGSSGEGVYAALTAAHARALGRVSAAIVAALEQLGDACRIPAIPPSARE
jgi:uncharacterized lipoprotein YmbA